MAVEVATEQELVWYPDLPQLLQAIKRIGAGTAIPSEEGGWAGGGCCTTWQRSTENDTAPTWVCRPAIRLSMAPAADDQAVSSEEISLRARGWITL